MNSERVAPETRGVTVELLSTVDLGAEIGGASLVIESLTS